MANFEKDEHFESFTNRITKKLKRKKTNTARQKAQVEGLVKAEVDFRKELTAHDDLKPVMTEFVRYITEVHRNILLALPFFRERSEALRANVGTIFKANEATRLVECHLNGSFVQWYLDRFGKAHKGQEIERLANEVMKRRDEIVYENIPLAISKAKGFWKKTQKSQLSYMDMIQIANEGLINAVDKYCLPYSTNFRAVIIGRITGDLIDAYSKRMVLFPSKDRRRLYHANKLVRFASDTEDLVTKVNAKLPEDFHTDRNQLEVLMNAASHFSLDSPRPKEGSAAVVNVSKSERFSTDGHDWLTASEDVRPDVTYERRELNEKLTDGVRGLSVFARKLLALKGFAIEGVMKDE